MIDNHREEASKQVLRLRVIFISLMSIFVVCIYFVALASLPNNPINLRYASKFNIVSFLPEGWAFFTRDAREDVMYVYKKMPDNHWERVNVPGSSGRYFFGLNRKGRAIGPELAVLLKQINSTEWLETRQPIERYFINDTIRKLELTDNCPAPLCTGDLMIKIGPPIPWAWAGSGKQVIMPYKIVRLYVKPGNTKS